MMDRHAAYAARHEAMEWLKVGRFDLTEVALWDAERLMAEEKVQVPRFNVQCQLPATGLQSTAYELKP